jgi:translation initiation factor IF-1
MVKNTHGGSGHKGQARKNVIHGKQSSNTRLRNPDDDEMYAQVLNILGGSTCLVICQDNVERLCVIRGKFRGRGKRDNTLNRGAWILVALRTWAGTTAKGKEQCDLLELYSEIDKKKLQAMETQINWSKFLSNDATNAFNTVQTDEQAGFEFSDERTDEYSDLMNSGGQKMVLDDFKEEEEINVDDI